MVDGMTIHELWTTAFNAQMDNKSSYLLYEKHLAIYFVRRVLRG
jgi:hypothetical protein